MIQSGSIIGNQWKSGTEGNTNKRVPHCIYLCIELKAYLFMQRIVFWEICIIKCEIQSNNFFNDNTLGISCYMYYLLFSFRVLDGVVLVLFCYDLIFNDCIFVVFLLVILKCVYQSCFLNIHLK